MSEVKKCPTCSGRGWIEDYKQEPMPDGSAVRAACKQCDGEGEYLT